MKTTLSTIICSALLATGMTVSVVVAPAQAKSNNSTSNNSNSSNSNKPSTTPTTTPTTTTSTTPTTTPTTTTSTTPTTTPTTTTSTTSSTGSTTLSTNSTTPLTNFNIFTFGFGNVLGGDTAGDSIFSQFNFNVSQTSNNKILFQFENTGAKSDAFISQIKFSDPNSLLKFNAFAPGFNVGNVSFKEENKNLAQSANITGWVDSFGFATTDQGAGNGGIDKGEKLGLLFDGNFDNVISNLKSNLLQIGMHVQGIAVANGKSDVYVSNYLAPVVPPIVETPAPVVPVTPPIVETPSQPVSVPVVETPSQPVSVPVVETPSQPVSVPVVETPTQPVSVPVVETPTQPVSVPVAEAAPKQPVSVPEPATLAGLGLAFGGMLASRRRKSH